MRQRGFTLLNTLGLLAVGVYYAVLFFLPPDLSNPSAEYYVADYAQALDSASKDYFISTSERIFALSEKNSLGGLQVVVATYAYPEGTSTTYDKTELFRKWQIGANDMGLLFLYSYEQSAAGTLKLFKLESEIGYRLSGYLSAGAMGTIFDQSFASVKDYQDLTAIQTAQAQAYALALQDVLPEAYDLPFSAHTPEDFVDYQIHYDGPTYAPSKPLNALDYAFSRFGGFFASFGIPLLLLGFVAVSDVTILAFGRGGSSGGGGVFRLFH